MFLTSVWMPFAWIAFFVYVFAAFTDTWDGILARKTNTVTTIGKFLDPISDKIFVNVILIGLIFLRVFERNGAVLTYVNIACISVMLAREFIIAVIRQIAADRRVIIAADWFGKAKTLVSLISFGGFILGLFRIDGIKEWEIASDVFHYIGLSLFYVATGFSLFSGINYYVKNKSVIFAPEPVPEVGTKEIKSLVGEVFALCGQKSAMVSVAESLTGGLISAFLVEREGASKCLYEGVVTYSNESKRSRLGVKNETLKEFGAVSAEVAAQMAEGLYREKRSAVTLSTTGIAGPGGGSEDKPVGLTYIGVHDGKTTQTYRFVFEGDREAVRRRTTEEGLRLLKQALENL
jgi:CDP-diacylglycerol--glycerol-3-phosphate 3-phosphatidyltransferase